MKQQIDNLIANTLLDEKEVYLPNIGSLILRRNSAKRLSSKKLQRPYYELTFTSEERGVNIVLLISKVANVSEERAADIYAEWFEQSKRNDVTTIEGLCSIKDRVVTTNEAFEAMANPHGRDVKKIKPRSSYRVFVIIGFLLGVAIGAATAPFLSDIYSENLTDKEDVPTTVQVENEEVKPIEEAVQQSDSLIVELVEQQPVEPIVEQTEAPTENTAAEPRLKVKTGKSYAVWGVYDELANAERYLLWLKERFPKIKAEIYCYDARYMVALCETSSREACNKKVAAWKKQYKSFKNVWVYTR